MKLYYFRRTNVGEFTYSGYWESYKDNITMDGSVPVPPVIRRSPSGVQIIKVYRFFNNKTHSSQKGHIRQPWPVLHLFDFCG